MKKYYSMFIGFTKQMREQNISTFSAGTAFFLFLSFVPMMILIFSVIPYTPLSEEMIQKIILEFTPHRVNPFLNSLIKEVYDTSIGVLSLAAIMMIWTASQGVLALIRGLNAVYEVKEERNYILLRLIAVFYMLIMMTAMFLSLFILVFGNKIVSFIVNSFPQMDLFFSGLMNFRFLFVWLFLTIVFAAIFAYIPNIRLKFKKQLLGATFSAAVWELFSWGFSLYVDHTKAFSIYGSLSMIIIFLFWLYVCIYIMMIGAHINRYVFLNSNLKDTKVILDKSIGSH